MADIGAMDLCPARKDGAHRLIPLVPDDAGMDMTLFCDRCGAMRRVPVTGQLMPVLDDMDADTTAGYMASILAGSETR